MPKPLVIVESPAKARTIAGFLGDDYFVESSVGHIRDLPRSKKDVPEAYKKEKWAGDGVDVDNDFKPLYVVSPDKKDKVRELKALLKDASEVYLATDEDREGEAISWHLLELLSPRVPVKRMVFHEITRAAIEHAVANPRDLNMKLVDAQETRRVLDRLYGYRLSEVLWLKSSGKSAGRVQSVALRLVVERERARMAFHSASYWDIDATFRKEAASFKAGLASVDGKRLANGKDFDANSGALTVDRLLLDESSARGLADRLTDRPVVVRSVEEKPYRSSPKPPFITSTLQQEAGRKLGMTASRAMRAAQGLYENGFITYMRTDSTTLSEQAVVGARRTATELYGAPYVPESPRQYNKKVKNAQEAHEAIRPAGDAFRHPDEVSREVDNDQARVYELIWKRTIASQMADAVGTTVSVRLGVVTEPGEDCEFAASGTVISFPGYKAVYEESSDDEEAGDDDRVLPPLVQGDALTGESYAASGHDTKPPARFTEASLIAKLEELGIGRPSTYASIIGTLLDPRRNYAFKKGSALVPSWTAFAVVQLLESEFAKYVDYDFTRSMEDDLDKIASGEAERVPWLTEFYFGSKNDGLQPQAEAAKAEADAAKLNSVVIGANENGEPVVVRVGKYGPYLQVGDQNGPSLAENIQPDELTVEKALELFNAPSSDRELGADPATGLAVLAKNGKYGPYVQLGEVEVNEKGKVISKPKSGSLFSNMDLETITLDDALKLLSLPREVGANPGDGEVITAQNGRYGPYLTKGVDSRSLDSEDQIFAITLDEAAAIYAQPKQWGRKGVAKPPLAEFGADPISGKQMLVKDGRFGPYVTDGETNATIPAGVAIESLTEERAIELLAEKRAKGPAPKKAASKRAPAKKKASTKPSAKKPASAKKSPAPKTTS